MFIQKQNTLFAGIDIHKLYAYVTIMNVHGQIQYQGRFENREEKLLPHLLSYNQPIETTVEASYGWYWLADSLEKANISITLAHPKKVNALVGSKKTDKEDSKALANLLRTNLLPAAYIPTRWERSMKELLRFRLQLVEHRSSLKRRLHDILAKQNISCDFTDILGKSARVWILSLSCPSPYKEEIDSVIILCDQISQQVEQITNRLMEIADNDPSMLILQTIPGVGKILSMTLVSEIGDIHRFANDRALSSYAGVVPSVYSSGDKTRLGQTGNRGNQYIRWALAEAIVHVTSEGKPFHDMYEALKEKKGAPKARVAVMNKLLRVIYSMLKHGQPFRVEKQEKSNE